MTSSPSMTDRLGRAASWPLILLVRLYQVTLGPLMGGHCRFQPTCSNYAIEALTTHGALRGTWLTIRRLLCCHPFGGGGYDPVPPKKMNHGDTEARRGESNGLENRELKSTDPGAPRAR